MRRPPATLKPPVLGLEARVLTGGVRLVVRNPSPTLLEATEQVRAEVTFWKEDGTLVRTTFADGAPATFPLGIVRDEGLRDALRTMGPGSVAEVHLAAHAWRPSGILPGVPLLARVESLVPVPRSRGGSQAPPTPAPPPPEHAPAAP